MNSSFPFTHCSIFIYCVRSPCLIHSCYLSVWSVSIDPFYSFDWANIFPYILSCTRIFFDIILTKLKELNHCVKNMVNHTIIIIIRRLYIQFIAFPTKPKFHLFICSMFACTYTKMFYTYIFIPKKLQNRIILPDIFFTSMKMHLIEIKSF